MVLRQAKVSHVSSLAFSPDGTIAVAPGDEAVILWNFRSGAVERILRGHTDRAWSAAFSPNGKVIASANDEEIILWDSATGAVRQRLAEGGDVVVISPDGRLLAAGSVGKAILVDMERPTRRRRLAHEDGLRVETVAFSPDGRVLATGSGDETIQLWDTERGVLLRTLWKGFCCDAARFAWSPDGRLLAVARNDGTITLLDARTGSLRGTLTHVSGLVSRGSSVAFSPDSETLISSGGSAVKVWNVHTLKAMAEFDYQRSVRALAFTPDGQRVATVGDGGLQVWDAGNGRLIATLLILAPRPVQRDPQVEWVTITADGYYRASPGAKRFIHWRVGERLHPARAYERTFHRPDLVEQALRSR